jgi:hypothetical protein
MQSSSFITWNNAGAMQEQPADSDASQMYFHIFQFKVCCKKRNRLRWNWIFGLMRCQRRLADRAWLAKLIDVSFSRKPTHPSPSHRQQLCNTTIKTFGKSPTHFPDIGLPPTPCPRF